MLALSLIGVTVYVGSLRQDAIQREAEQRIVGQSIQALGQGIGNTVRDYARWNDSVANLLLALDPVWADDNIGPYVHTAFGYGVSVVLAGDGRTIYGQLDGKRTTEDAVGILGPAVQRLAELARQAAEPDARPASSVLDGPAGLFVAAASAILPESGSTLMVPAGPPAVLVFGRRLDEAFLQELGSNFGLDHLAFSEAAATGAGLAHVELRDPTGTVVRRIAWLPRQPGRAQTVWLLPALAGALLISAVFGILVMRADRLILALRKGEDRYRAIVEDQTELICRHLPDTTLTFVNGAFCRHFGRRAHELIGRKLIDLVPARAGPVIGDAITRLSPGDVVTVELEAVQPDCSVGWQQWTERAIGDPVIEYQAVGRDITERRRAEQQIRDLALADPLTGLPNRRALLERLEIEIASAREHGGSVVLCMVDLDHFKTINDSLGHSTGDALLIEAAQRLRQGAPEGSVVARLGGDEFAVLAAGSIPEDELAQRAERLVDQFRRPFIVRGSEMRIGATVGIASHPADAPDAEMLLAHADLALYAGKKGGRGTWRLFRPVMHEQASRRATLDRDLRLAVERGEFALHFQPIVEIEGLRLRGFEALLRWQHPEQGSIPPSAFLAAAERNRLIVPLTFWAVDEALRHAAAWRAAGIGPVQVAVNLAASALDTTSIAEHAGERLRAHGMTPDSLLVEVTEGVIADGRRAMAALQALRSLGIQIAIDDFGAGYSSLARLRDLPLDVLKIDRAFIAPPHARSESILRAVVDLARGLDLPTVIEGVENADQLDLVRRVGVTCAQGYLMGRPMPADAVQAWAQAWTDGRLRAPAHDLLSRTRNAAV